MRVTKQQAFSIALKLQNNQKLTSADINKLCLHLAPNPPKYPTEGVGWAALVSKAVTKKDTHWTSFVKVLDGTAYCTDGMALRITRTSLGDGYYCPKTLVRIDDELGKPGTFDIKPCVELVSRTNAHAEDLDVKKLKELTYSKDREGYVTSTGIIMYGSMQKSPVYEYDGHIYQNIFTGKREENIKAIFLGKFQAQPTKLRIHDNVIIGNTYDNKYELLTINTFLVSGRRIRI